MKKFKSVLRIVLILLCIGIMAFCGYKLYETYAEYAAGTELYDDLTNHYVVPVEPPESVPQEDTPTVETAPLSVDFAALLEENSDVVAWIYCADTAVNYPVVQSDDNSYYLRRMLNGKYNIAGTLFMDYRCPADLSCWNTIIYGHNVKNGSMFGILPYYKDPAYYEVHPVWYLLTPDAEYKIELVAGYITPYDSDAYNIPQTREERDALLAMAKENSTFVTDTVVGEWDRLITLSTCTYEYDDARYVLVGVLRPLGEAADAGISQE